MPTPLHTFQGVVQTAWEAITPPVDGSGVAEYNFVDDFDEERGGGQHRQLVWRLAQRAAVINIAPEAYEWTVEAELFIHRFERTYNAFRQAVENEASALVVVFDGLTAFGAGVSHGEHDEFIITEPEPERGERAGGIPRGHVARVTFRWRVLCEET